MIAEGTYAATAKKIETDDGPRSIQFGQSGEKKTPLCSVVCEILRGPFAGQTITWYGYFTDKPDVTRRTIEGMRAFGFTGDDLAAMMFQHPDQEAEIVVNHETYKGRLQARVAFVNLPRSGLKVENQLRDGALRQFSAQMQSALKATPSIAGKKAVREAPAAAPAQPASQGKSNDDWGPPDTDPNNGIETAGDDDIPF